MKLVEILARELEKWPEGAAGFTQDKCGEVWPCTGLDVEFNGERWTSQGLYTLTKHRFESDLATDYTTAIVTHAEWQAERNRIAKPGKKTNTDGWIRHRGGKCPVSQSDFIEYRMRAGGIGSCCGQIELLDWSHSGSGGDIMSYRFRKQSDEEMQLHQAVKDARNSCANQQIDLDLSPLIWRDRIREIDRTVEELEEERVSLIQRLEGEGFKIIEQVNAKIAEAAQAHEDMSDPSKWRKGDFVECITDHSPGRQFSKGLVYELRSDYDGGSVKVVSDDNGSRSNGMMPEHFKFHSRTSA